MWFYRFRIFFNKQFVSHSVQLSFEWRSPQSEEPQRIYMSILINSHIKYWFRLIYLINSKSREREKIAASNKICKSVRKRIWLSWQFYFLSLTLFLFFIVRYAFFDVCVCVPMSLFVIDEIWVVMFFLLDKKFIFISIFFFFVGSFTKMLVIFCYGCTSFIQKFPF